MRKADHQLQQTLYIQAWQKVGKPPLDYSAENTGYTFAPIKDLRALCVEHADVLPDEATWLTPAPVAPAALPLEGASPADRRSRIRGACLNPLCACAVASHGPVLHQSC